MTVLVSGGAGYIGSHMVLELRDRGENVVVVDNLSTGVRGAVPEDVDLLVADIGDVETMLSILRTRKVRSVIHFAARLVVPESVADPLGYYLANTVKTRALLAACTAAGVEHFIFSSTAAVYGDVDMKPVREDDPAAPLSPYGASKLMSEWMLRDVARASGLGYVVLRYFNVAGSDPAGRTGQSTPNATHLIKVAVQTALGQRSHMEIFGQDYPTHDGTCLRDYIHVCDLVSAHAQALDYLRAGGESLLVNAGYGQGYSVREVVDTVRRVTGVDFDVRQAPRRAGDPVAVIADSSRIRRTLGWRPKLNDLEAIVSHSLAWERKLLKRP